MVSEVGDTELKKVLYNWPSVLLKGEFGRKKIRMNQKKKNSMDQKLQSNEIK